MEWFFFFTIIHFRDGYMFLFSVETLGKKTFTLVYPNRYLLLITDEVEPSSVDDRKYREQMVNGKYTKKKERRKKKQARFICFDHSNHKQGNRRHHHLYFCNIGGQISDKKKKWINISTTE